MILRAVDAGGIGRESRKGAIVLEDLVIRFVANHSVWSSRAVVESGIRSDAARITDRPVTLQRIRSTDIRLFPLRGFNRQTVARACRNICIHWRISVRGADRESKAAGRAECLLHIADDVTIRAARCRGGIE